jgi:ABC-type anion transport system duplicated permease subunit
MPVIATDTQRLSNLIKKYDAPNNPELFNEVVTVNQAAQTTLKVGTVMGKITASGKYIVAVETAVDGSKVPAGIFIGDANGLAQDTVIAATTDTPVLVLARGKAVVSKDALFLDATYNDNTKKNTAYAALKALGIMVETTV